MKKIMSLLVAVFTSFTFAQDSIPTIKFLESENGKFGLTDMDGNILVDTIYDENVYISLNQIKGEAMFKKGGNWMIVNYKNEVVLDLSSYSSFSTSFSKGLLSVTDENTGKSGYINRKGEIVIPFKYEMTYSFEEDFPYATASVNGKWGIIDTEGNWIMGPKYEHIYEIISENEFIVLIEGTYYGVNLAGKILYEEELGC
jgi:hypothetical protein